MKRYTNDYGMSMTATQIAEVIEFDHIRITYEGDLIHVNDDGFQGEIESIALDGTFTYKDHNPTVDTTGIQANNHDIMQVILYCYDDVM